LPQGGVGLDLYQVVRPLAGDAAAGVEVDVLVALLDPAEAGVDLVAIDAFADREGLDRGPGMIARAWRG
jgi:hypothetical protein